MEARRTQCPSRFSGIKRGASDTGESPWRQLRERAEKIPGDKKHDPGLTEFSHRVVARRSSIQHRNAAGSRRKTTRFATVCGTRSLNPRAGIFLFTKFPARACGRLWKPLPTRLNTGVFFDEDCLHNIILFHAVCYSCFSAIPSRGRKGRNSSRHPGVQNPVAAARGKAIDVSLGYSYVSHMESNSNRVGLNGADASFTLGTSRLGIRMDLG